MASTNLHTVRALFDAFERRDAAALVELFHEDGVFEPASTAVAPRDPYLGHAGIGRYFADLDATWDRFRVTVSGIREDGDVVVALGRIYAAGSGFVGDDPAGFVVHLREGRIAWAKVFTSHEAALEAAGLRPPMPPPSTI